MSLPLELFDLILSFETLSAGVLRLWQTGDRSIQHRISNGVSTIDLRATTTFSTNRLPKLLPHLRALRELTINREWSGLLGHQHTLSTFRELPPSIQSLRLRWRSSNDLFFPPDDLIARYRSLSDTSSTDTSEWTIKKALPHLETLEFHGIQNWTFHHFECLPSTLTSLEISTEKTNDLSVIPLLPRQLLSVRLLITALPSALDIRQLPPTLTSQRIWWSLKYPQRTGDVAFHSEVVDSFPKTLTEVPRLEHFPAASLARLPPRLVKLALSNSEELIDLPNLASILPDLTDLEVGSCTISTINGLPSGVTQINLTLPNGDQTACHWPKSLNWLGMWRQKETFNPSVVPSWVTTLRVDSLITSTVSLLPKTLTILEFTAIEYTETIDFPPGLKDLSIVLNEENEWLRFAQNSKTAELDGRAGPQLVATDANLNGAKVERCFPFEHIPSGVTLFEMIGKIPASRLKYLPSRLKTIYITDIFEDADFDRHGATEIALMKANFEIGRQEGVREIVSLEELTTASSVALLPRTLTDLSMDCNESFVEANATDWRLAPPALRNLTFRATKGPIASELLSIPHASMIYLTVALREASDEHLKALAEWKLQYSSCTFVDSLPLTARYLPLYMFIGSSDNQFKADHSALQKLRAKHLLDDDPTEFLRLTTWPPPKP